MIHPIGGPVGLFDLGGRVFDGCHIGPWVFVNGPLLDPLLEDFNFLRLEGFVRFHRGHGIFLVEDADDEFALLGLTRYDGSFACFLELGIGAFRGVETESGFSMIGIWAVAEEALVGENGTDVTVEIELLAEAGAEQRDAQP